MVDVEPPQRPVRRGLLAAAIITSCCLSVWLVAREQSRARSEAADSADRAAMPPPRRTTAGEAMERELAERAADPRSATAARPLLHSSKAMAPLPSLGEAEVEEPEQEDAYLHTSKSAPRMRVRDAAPDPARTGSATAGAAADAP